MLYQFNEGTVKVSDAFKDRTLHMLVPFGAGAGFTLIIGHDELEAGETLETFLNRQLSDMTRQVTKFQQTAREPAHLGNRTTGIAGIGFEFQFKQRTQMIYQRQAVFLMGDKKTVLSVTASAAAPFDAAQQAMWNDILASFVPRA